VWIRRGVIRDRGSGEAGRLEMEGAAIEIAYR
jgi:hypothetical protein